MPVIPIQGVSYRCGVKYVSSPERCVNRIQRITIKLVTGVRHLPYEERLQGMGPHSLQRQRLRADLNTTSKVFAGLLDIDPNLFFLPPARRGLKGYPYKVLQASVVEACSVNIFKKRLEKVWTEVFPHLPAYKCLPNHEPPINLHFTI